MIRFTTEAGQFLAYHPDEIGCLALHPRPNEGGWKLQLWRRDSDYTDPADEAFILTDDEAYELKERMGHVKITRSDDGR